MPKPLFSILLLLTLSACAPPLVEPAALTPLGSDHIAYYGFAGIDCAFDAPNDAEIKSNYLDEVAGFTNIGHLCVYAPDEDLAPRLQAFSDAGLRALLHVEMLLFEHLPDASSPTGVQVRLRSDAAAVWDVFIDKNGALLTSEVVAVVYVIDEPVWNGVSAADFEAALQLIKTALPDLPTLAIEAYPVVDQIMVPETLDWVGFDRYDSADPARDPAWLADLETVRAARTRPDQKLVIVSSTQWLPYFESGAGIGPADVLPIIESYYTVAQSDPDVIALVGYLWPGGLDDPEQLGARDLPEVVQARMRQIGLEIVRPEQVFLPQIVSP